MKLFIYEPKGRGESTFSVNAETEAEAFQKVNNFVNEKYFKNGKYEYEANGWGTDYYQLEVKESTEVFEQFNS